jgi:hypothetical protein
MHPAGTDLVPLGLAASAIVRLHRGPIFQILRSSTAPATLPRAAPVGFKVTPEFLALRAVAPLRHAAHVVGHEIWQVAALVFN